MQYDFIVVGLGGLGSVVAHDLAANGAQVLGLDRHPLGHAFGSSHGRTRVIRKAYFEHVDYVPLLHRSYDRWRHLEDQTDQNLFDQCGVLQIGPRNGVVVPGVLRAAKDHQLEVHAYAAHELRKRYPQLKNIAEDELGVLEPDGGMLSVEACVRAWGQLAQQQGAHVRIGDHVEGYSHEGDYWRVITNQKDYRTKVLILCPGAWATQLLPTILSRHLEVRRKSLFWFDSEPSLSRSRGFPVWLFEEPDGVFYGFPHLDGQGFKAAEHSGGQRIKNPTNVNRSIDPHDQHRIDNFLARRMGGVDRKNRLQHAVCMYTVTPDEHFMIGQVRGFHDLFVGAGLSGHGFKMVPALGECLANQALGRSDAISPNWLDPNRFN